MVVIKRKTNHLPSKIAVAAMIIAVIAIIPATAFPAGVTAPGSDLFACIRCEMADDIYQLYAQATDPVIINRTTPMLPAELEALAGTVVLEVTVLPDSTIGYVDVKESIPGLDSLAVEAVKQWEFLPAFREDEPVIGFLDVEVEFEIEENDEPLTEEERKELEQLREEIARFVGKEREIMKHRLLKLPLPTQSENYHLFSPYRPEPLIRKNDFTILPAYTGAVQTFQTHYPFLRYEIRPHRWNLYTEDYPFEVTLVDAYLGLGHLDMDYGHINLQKNNLFEIENLQINTGFITESGYWMGGDGITDSYLDSKAREQRSDMMADLFYERESFSLRWNTSFVNQRLPAAKLRHIADTDTLRIEKNLSEHSLYIANNYLNLGVRYEQLEYKAENFRPERTLWQLSVNRPLSYQDHTLSLQWESFFISEEDLTGWPYTNSGREDFLEIGYRFEPDIMYLKADVMSGLGYQYKAYTEAGFRFFERLEMGLGYIEKETDFEAPPEHPEDSPFRRHLFHQNINNDIYTVFTFREKKSDSHSFDGYVQSRIGRQTIGQHSHEQQAGLEYFENYFENDSFYLNCDYSLTRRFERIDLSIYGTVNYYEDVTDLLFMPDLFLRNTVSVSRRLEHDNIITLGLTHHHASGYDRAAEVNAEQTNRLDAFLRLSLTDKFDIQGDAINLTDSDHLYGIADRSGMHFNLGIRWFFFN